MQLRSDDAPWLEVPALFSSALCLRPSRGDGGSRGLAVF